jgi:hypothetical protein
LGYDPDFATEVQWDVPLLDGYNWVEIPNIGTDTESFLGLCNPGLWRLIRGKKFNAVFCHTGYLKASFWIAFLAARLSGSVFLFGTDANSLAPRDSQSWKVAVKEVLWPRLFSIADQIIVPSSRTRDLMRSLGFAEDQITLTPYCVDNDGGPHNRPRLSVMLYAPLGESNQTLLSFLRQAAAVEAARRPPGSIRRCRNPWCCPGFRRRRSTETNALPKGSRLEDCRSYSFSGFRKSIGVAGCVHGSRLDGSAF